MSKKSKLTVVPATEDVAPDAPEVGAQAIVADGIRIEGATVPAPRLPYFDHTACTHEKTPKARAACRAKGEAAAYYGRDKAPKADAPTKTRKGRKAALVIVPEADLVEAPAPKAKKVKLPRVMWSSKGTGAITHWAVLTDDLDADGNKVYTPACGNKLSAYVLDRAAEVLGCTKCRAKGAPAS